MNKKSLFFIVFVSILLISNSCTNDDKTVKPEILIEELGHDNSKVGYAGSDFHVDAEIVAINRIDKVRIEIHYEEDHESKSKLVYKNEWEFDLTYTEFSGLKNVNFHKDLSIPEVARPGIYHFGFSVTDMEGNFSLVEEEIEIKQHE